MEISCSVRCADALRLQFAPSDTPVGMSGVGVKPLSTAQSGVVCIPPNFRQSAIELQVPSG